VKCFVCLSALTITIPLQSQTVSGERGNIIYKDKGGRVVQVTSLGLDSDPEISKDGKWIVFVRRTPSLKIGTGLGDTDDNEIWVAGVSRGDQAKRVLVGHSGGFTVGENMVLGGFSRPQFSPDGGRIYFIAQVWATASSIRVLETSNPVRHDLSPQDCQWRYSSPGNMPDTSSFGKQFPLLWVGALFAIGY
jgi:dipeptidyl aminopeptidase/acylaminoacyl peptidase